MRCLIRDDLGLDELAYGVRSLVSRSSRSNRHEAAFPKNCVREPCRFSLQAQSLKMTVVGAVWSSMQTIRSMIR